MINITQLNKFRSIINKNKDYLDSISSIKADDEKKYSMSVSMAVLMEYLALNQEEAKNAITDSGNDNKIDAFYYSDDEDELSELIIIQSKYKQNDGDTGSISEDEIKLCIDSCKKILKGQPFRVANETLQKKLESYRELLKNNHFPEVNIKLFFATNGLIHPQFRTMPEVIECYENHITPLFIDATSFGNNVSIEFGELEVNLKNDEDKTDSVFSIGNELFSGKIVTCTIDNLMKFYKATGERLLLSSNVRYLIKNSTINKLIRESFIDDPLKFCYLNNGITLTSSNFELFATGHPFTKIKLTNPSIVNGGQTISTLYNLYITKYADYEAQFKSANILIRIYKAPNDYSIKIAQATNSQNPISLVDLKSNDTAQDIAKQYLSQFGIGLLTKLGEDITFYNDTITNEHILQVYASLYGDEPGKAKASKSYTFKKYYQKVFTNTINEQMCKRLFRCYHISKFINSDTTVDRSILQNAFYSIIYAMKKNNSNLKNENIPSRNIVDHFRTSLTASMVHINAIIEQKRTTLGTKFSMNNLFKGNEIKDLIDLRLER